MEAGVAEELARLASAASFELTPREALAPHALAGLAPGTRVYLTALGTVPFDEVPRAAARIAASGMIAVPHLAVRVLADASQLERRLAALASAGVGELLLIAGSNATAGGYESTLAVLDSGLLEAHGFRRIGVAGHPEGSPDIPDAELAAALAAKDAVAARGALTLYVVTQFCFAPEPYVEWERTTRASGSTLPVWPGLPGLTTMSKLLRYGIACGVGPSLARLRKQTGLLRLAGRRTFAPDAIATGIARAAVTDPAARFAGLHFFAFGGLERTVAWASALAAGRFELHPSGGLRVSD